MFYAGSSRVGRSEASFLTRAERRVTARIACRVLAAVAMAGIAGCLGPFPAHPDTVEHPSLRLEVFFSGHTRGNGTLTLLTGQQRSLKVQGYGRADADGSFHLDQIVTFEDGAVEKRTWRLARSGVHTYTVTLSDAAGPVSAEGTGNRFHLRYLLRKPAVHMEQWLYLRPDGRTVLNLATITALGIPWARLTEEITRIDEGEQK